MDLGKLVVGVGKLVAKQCDAYVRSKTSDKETVGVFATIAASKVTNQGVLVTCSLQFLVTRSLRFFVTRSLFFL